MSDLYSGGCQCGAVRFRATGPLKAAICHCRMCQKAFGNYFAPLVTAAKLEWTRGAPTYFRSSNKASRGFCAHCGTPLCAADDDGWVELAGGAFDDPAVAPPGVQWVLKDKVSFFDTLHTVQHQPHQDLEDAQNATIASHQHPDHDTADWPPLREQP